MRDEAGLPLEGLYLHLVRSGFPVSIREYQDALAALRAGYGVGGREDLRWLCEALWARTDQEVSRLQRLFRALPRPTPEQVREWAGEPRAAEPSRPTEGGSAGGAVPRAARPAPEGMPIVEFAPAAQAGVGLPRARVPVAAGEAFIFTPRPLISLRALIVAWRRFRLTQRSGPRVELDLDATVAEKCRRGTLLEPVLLPARRNQARLMVLVDASPSMVAWRHMNALWAESLEGSQLARHGLHFFDNVPDRLCPSDTLARPVPLAEMLQAHPERPALIVSDAGAARGRLVRDRLEQTRELVERARSTWQPMAWLNPMPRARWGGSSAERIARIRGLAMFELSPDGLIHAVDYLRGKRSA